MAIHTFGGGGAGGAGGGFAIGDPNINDHDPSSIADTLFHFPLNGDITDSEALLTIATKLNDYTLHQGEQSTFPPTFVDERFASSDPQSYSTAINPPLPEAPDDGTKHLTICILAQRFAGAWPYAVSLYGTTQDWAIGCAAAAPRIVYNGANAITGTTSMAANTWYHLAMTIKDNTTTRDIRLFVNGVEEGTAAVGVAGSGSINSKLHIGTNDGSGNGWQGKLRSCIGIGRELSAAQILALKNATIG